MSEYLPEANPTMSLNATVLNKMALMQSTLSIRIILLDRIFGGNMYAFGSSKIPPFDKVERASYIVRIIQDIAEMSRFLPALLS